MDNNNTTIKTKNDLAAFGEALADIHERIELFMDERPDRFSRIFFEGIEGASSDGITIRTCDYDNDHDSEFIEFDDLFAEGWKERAKQARDEARRREEQRRLEAERKNQAIREANERATYERLRQKFEKMGQ